MRDACPSSVLAASAGLATTAALMLAAPLTDFAVVTGFGDFWTGKAAAASCITYAVASAWCARALYRLDLRGWWATVIMILAMLASQVMTFANHDPVGLYARMSPSAYPRRLYRRSPDVMGAMIVWGPVALLVPTLGYMVYIRRHFRRS